MTVTKGIRFLEKNCSIDICNIIAEKFKNEIDRRHRMRHHRELFFAEYHNVKYEYEIMNIRAETRVSRDLEQDLQDIANGICVIHESDSIVRLEQAKKDRRNKALDNRVKKYKKMLKEKGFENLDCAEKRRVEKMIRKGLLCEDDLEVEKKPEQITLF